MNEGTGEMEYDIKYTGFPEDEAYEYDKPASEVESPEGFEGAGDEDADKTGATVDEKEEDEEDNFDKLQAQMEQSGGGDDEEEGDEALPVFSKGDKVHGHIVEEDEWYAATVVEARTNEGTGEMEYDLRYTGFPEEEAYEYDKPASEVASPEEFEEPVGGGGVGEYEDSAEDSAEEEEEDENESEAEKNFRRTSLQASVEDLHNIEEEASDEVFDEDEDDLSRFLTQFGCDHLDLYDAIADACGGSTCEALVAAGERTIHKAGAASGLTITKVRRLYKEAQAQAEVNR
jgi:hypothetical protein